jgi:hypothetical protein
MAMCMQLCSAQLQETRGYSGMQNVNTTWTETGASGVNSCCYGHLANTLRYCHGTLARATLPGASPQSGRVEMVASRYGGATPQSRHAAAAQRETISDVVDVTVVLLGLCTCPHNPHDRMCC